jgi:hypothetical protein
MAIKTIDLSKMFLEDTVEKHRIKNLACNEEQKEKLDYTLNSFNNISDLFKVYKGNPDNWIEVDFRKSSVKKIKTSLYEGIPIYYSTILRKIKNFDGMSIFFTNLDQAKLKSQYDIVDKIINTLDVDKLNNYYPVVYKYKTNLNLLEIDENFINDLTYQMTSYNPLNIDQTICKYVGNDYDGVEVKNSTGSVILLCNPSKILNLDKYTEKFIYSSEDIDERSDLLKILKKNNTTDYFDNIKYIFNYPKIQIDFIDQVYPYYRTELETCMKDFSQQELAEMYKKLSDYVMSRITTVLRVEIYEMIGQIRKMIENCAEIVVAGAEAINFSFLEIDRDISTDIDTKLVPLFNLTVDNWKEYIIFLVKFRNYFWYNVLDTIVEEWNKRYENYIYSFMVRLEGILSFIGLKFQAPFDKKKKRPFSKRFTPMYKTGYVDKNNIQNTSHGMIYDVMLYSVDFNYELFLPLTHSGILELEEDDNIRYGPYLQLQEFSYGVLDIPIITNSFITNTRAIDNISNYLLSSDLNSKYEGLVINPTMTEDEFNGLLQSLSQELYFVNKNYSAHDIERLVESKSRPEKFEKDTARLKKIKNAPEPSGTFHTRIYEAIEECNANVNCSDRCFYTTEPPSYLKKYEKLGVFCDYFVTYGSIFKTFYFITPSIVLLNCKQELLNVLKSEGGNININPFKEIETNIFYDDSKYLYIECDENNFCDYVTERRKTHKIKMNIEFFKQFSHVYTWAIIVLKQLNNYIESQKPSKRSKSVSTVSTNKYLLSQMMYGFNIEINDEEYEELSEKEMAMSILQVGVNFMKMVYYPYENLSTKNECIIQVQKFLDYLLDIIKTY